MGTAVLIILRNDRYSMEIRETIFHKPKDTLGEGENKRANLRQVSQDLVSKCCDFNLTRWRLVSLRIDIN